MNTARLVFGWLFLAGFTAAGTYYAMDEVDHRVGLARFQLHEKLGVVRYAMAVPTTQTPPNNQTPPINNQTPPINNQVTPPNNNQTPPINTNPNPQPPIQTNPQPPIQTNPQPPIQTNPQPPIQSNPQPPISRNPQPPIQTNPQPPINNNPQPPATQRPRPADYPDAVIRLDQLKGTATRFRSTISRMHTPYGTARLDEPMSNLNRLLRQAEGALNNNDTATAKRYMDQADNEVNKLKELLDQ